MIIQIICIFVVCRLFYGICRDTLIAFAGVESREAYIRLQDWQARNPGVYIGLSPEGTRLVVDCITSYKRYIKMETWVKVDHGYLQMLEDLLNEFPDPSPEDMPFEQPDKKGCFLCAGGGTRSQITMWTSKLGYSM